MRELWINYPSDAREEMTFSQRLVYTQKPEPLPGEELIHVIVVPEGERSIELEILNMKNSLYRIQGFLEGSMDMLALRLKIIDDQIKEVRMAKKIMKKKTAKKVKKASK